MPSAPRPEPPGTEHPGLLPHLFTHAVDTVPVHCVRPSDTHRPTWAVYQYERYLGTLHHQAADWYLQHAREHHDSLDDAVRALRRPPTWPHARARATSWAHRALNTPGTCVINIQTTGLRDPRAVQIAVATPDGILVDTLINPGRPVDNTAARLHHHTRGTLRDAPTFSEALPLLVQALHGRRCIGYNMPFIRHVLRQELARLPIAPLLSLTRWEDAMRPVAQWAGLWSAHHRTYRNQRLLGPHEAKAKYQALLHRLSSLNHHPTST
ncbi:3'-5' exonuclease [Streptomyces sp. NBC_01207]|uniref:3'-5' exonuclease n=1 Tax=Streptomyces sp. NBC_01207 TaxID=2903772 RepID=UPI002E144468|nr:3'-5' exonuclease [Streptomyces sp. NBC_01207]